jgi:PAS domain S-box-containing protein
LPPPETRQEERVSRSEQERQAPETAAAGRPGLRRALELLAADGPLDELLDGLVRLLEREVGGVLHASIVAEPGEPATDAERTAFRRVEPAESRLRQAAGAGAIGTWVWEIGEDRVYADERLAAFFGLDAEQAADGLPLVDYLASIHPDDRERVAAAIGAAVESGSVYEAEYRVRGGDGRERWVLARGRVECDRDGNPRRFPGALSDVTGRVETEHALRVAQQQITAAVSAGRIGIWTWDAVADRVVADEMLAWLFGIDVELAARGVPLAVVVDAIHESDRPTVEAAIAHSLGTGESYDAEFRARGADGVFRWVRGSGSPHLDADGRVLGLAGMGTDVSADVALRESEERLRLALDALGAGTFVWFPDEDRVEQDARLLALCGLPADGTLSRAFAMADLVHPDDRSRLDEALSRAIDPSGPGTLHEEVRLVRADGRERWVAVAARTVFAPEPVRMTGLVIDVTARKRHDARPAFLARLGDALRALGDPEQVRLTAARLLCEHLGASRAEYVEAPGDLDRLGDAGSAVLSAPLIEDGRLVAALTVTDGAPRRWAADEVALVEEVAQRTWSAMERARAEAALRASDERLRRAVGIDTVGILFFTLDGRMTDANAAFERMSGYTREELLAAVHWETLTAPEFLDATARAAEELATRGETAPYEKQLVRKDGTRWWGLFAPTRLAGSGAESRCVEFVIDVTESRENEGRQTFLLAFADELRMVGDPREIMRIAAERLGRELGADRVGYAEIDETGRYLTVADDWTAGDAASMAGRHRIDDFGRVADELRAGRTIVLDDALDPAVTGGREEIAATFAAAGVRAGVAVPILRRGVVAGALFVHQREPRAWAQSEIALATELAERTWESVERARAHLEAERRAHATAAFTFVRDGVLLVDDDGLVRSWNPAAVRIAGLPEPAVLGRPVTEAIEGWTEIADRIPLAPAGAADPPDPATLPVQVGSRELWLSISGTVFRGGTVYTFGDVSLERAFERMRNDLVATVSHELRTPLAAIYGAAATLRRDDLELDDVVRRQFVEMIETQATRLTGIVEEILLASRLDAGEAGGERGPLDPVQLAREVVESAQAAHEGARIELRAPAAGETVVADEQKLAQVLRNLVENAVRYSDEGGRVEVRVEPRERRLRFAVADNGIGIAPDERERVFAKFYRVDSDMRRGVGGTGLGLYICRELVNRMEGRIWVESEVGKGSTFVFEVPIVGG